MRMCTSHQLRHPWWASDACAGCPSRVLAHPVMPHSAAAGMKQLTLFSLMVESVASMVPPSPAVAALRVKVTCTAESAGKGLLVARAGERVLGCARACVVWCVRVCVRAGGGGGDLLGNRHARHADTPAIPPPPPPKGAHTRSWLACTRSTRKHRVGWLGPGGTSCALCRTKRGCGTPCTACTKCACRHLMRVAPTARPLSQHSQAATLSV
jgi:hypothetical protein